VHAAANYTIKEIAIDKKTSVQSDELTFKVAVRLRATDFVL